MTVSEQGIKLIASHEGCVLKPYLCPAKVPTIGYGNTFYEDNTRVTMSDAPISAERAMGLLTFTVNKLAALVSYAVTSDVSQNQFDALCSLAYNIGIGNFKTSTVLRLVNENPNDEAIRDAFMMWVKANGNTLQGLVERRKKEADIYFS